MPSAGERIFSELFSVEISNAVSSVPEYEVFKLGDLATRDGGYGEYLADTQSVYKTINNIIELFRIGIVVGFSNYLDAGHVYNILDEHLNDWEEVLNNPVRCQEPPPAEDIVLIQQYMESIYEAAVFANGTLNRKAVLERRKFNPGFAGMFGSIPEFFTTPAVTETPKVSNTPVVPGGFFADLVNRRDG